MGLGVNDGPPPVSEATLNVRVSRASFPATPTGLNGNRDLRGGWRPYKTFGADAPGRLQLPDAKPTPEHMYAPRGVWSDGEMMIASDTGNHRVLIWNSIHDRESGAAADIVLGQPDFTSEGPAAGSADYERGMFLPTSVSVIDGKLIVADAWHHRILVWNQLPSANFAKPDYCIGQADLQHVSENRGSAADAYGLYWPFGFALIDGVFWVADTGNRRVVGWSGGLPSASDVPADLLLGQEGFSDHEENRGAKVSSQSFRWPHFISGDSNAMVVADAGNHRILGYGGSPQSDQLADFAVGQVDRISDFEWPYGPQGPAKLRFPYGVSLTLQRSGYELIVADTSNNRILIFEPDGIDPYTPNFIDGQSATYVLGQPNFDANGENNWQALTEDSLCWPYGIWRSGDYLFISDSGNNRVTVWHNQRAL